jgi:integrase
MKSDFLSPEMIEHVLFALTPENRLACRVALKTGLRIGDVVSMKTEELKKAPSQRFKVKITEQKTKKKRSVSLGKDLTEQLLSQSGEIFVFEGRQGVEHHRTRQAVYKDIKRASKAFRVKVNFTPHTLRKVYAVKLYQKYGNIAKVREALNHSNDAVTMIYALADLLSEQKK